MPIDFFGNYDPLATIPSPIQQQPQQNGPSFPPLPKEEEESLLSQLGSKALSGLSFVGQTLGKPGRSIRGLLGGQGASALANLIPFSDTLGITDPSKDVSGRDLLYKAGLTDAPQKGFEWADIPGFAAEVATDPLTYLTLGGSALTATGKAAQKAGTLAPRLAGRIAAGEGGLAGLHIPFTGIGTTLGTGPTAEKIAGKLGGAYDLAANSGPGRALASLFNKKYGGATSEIGQNAMATASDALPGLRAPLRQELSDHMDMLRPMDQATRQTTVDDALAFMEGRHGPTTSQAGIDLGTKLQGLNQKLHAMDLASGKDVGDVANYAHRTLTQEMQNLLEQGGKGRSRIPLDPTVASDLARNENFDIPGGIPAVNAIGKDAMVSGPNRTALTGNKLGGQNLLKEQEHIFENHLGGDKNELLTLKNQLNGLAPGQTMPPQAMARLQELDSLNNKAGGLAKWASMLPEETAPKGINWFEENPLKAMEKRIDQSAQSASKLGAVHDVVAEHAGLPVSPTDVPIRDVYEKLGLTTGNKQLTPGTMDNLLRRGITDTGNGTWALPRVTNPADLHLPADIAKDLTRTAQGFKTPDALKGPVGFIDALTNLFRMGNTNPITNPARFVRNPLQEIFGGLVEGANPLGEMGVAKNAFRGGATTPEAAELAKQSFIHQVAGPGNLTRDFEVTGQGGAKAGVNIPGDPRQGLGDILKSIIPTSNLRETANPLNIAGIGGRTEAKFAPAAAGRALDEYLSDLTRGGAYSKLLKEGWDPGAAAKHVDKAMYNYGNMSDFEKNVMRRIMPFYNWQRQNIPAVTRQLMERPGGLTAQGFRVADDVRKKEGFLPDYLSDSLSVPIGGEGPTGTQRFLTHTGLPFEDAYDTLQTGRGLSGNIGNTVRELMSQMNPLIKGPAELATGKQFMSGRDLADLSDKGLTGSPVIDQTIMNSPLARAATMLRTAGDERKGVLAKLMNYASPVKLSDVDMANQRDIAGRQQLEELLRQNPEVKQFSRLYVPKEQVAGLPPEVSKMMQLESNMIEAQQRAALQKRAEAGDQDAAAKLARMKQRQAAR